MAVLEGQGLEAVVGYGGGAFANDPRYDPNFKVNAKLVVGERGPGFNYIFIWYDAVGREELGWNEKGQSR